MRQNAALRGQGARCLRRPSHWSRRLFLMFIVHGVATIDDADAGLQPMRTRAPSAARSIFGLRFLLLLTHVNAGFVSVLSRYACRTPAQQAFRLTVQCRRTAACKGASAEPLSGWATERVVAAMKSKKGATLDSIRAPFDIHKTNIYFCILLVNDDRTGRHEKDASLHTDTGAHRTAQVRGAMQCASQGHGARRPSAASLPVDGGRVQRRRTRRAGWSASASLSQQLGVLREEG